jgi:hypothetical protein
MGRPAGILRVQPIDIANKGFQELSKHGPDGVFIALMFVLLILGSLFHLDWWILLSGLVICCWFYHRRRCESEAHVIRLATLPVQQEESRIAELKAPHRAKLGLDQPQLQLGQPPRRLR